MVRLAQYSATTVASRKPFNCEICAIPQDDPSACADGCQQKSADPAEGHRARAAATYVGIYVCGVVIGWGLVDVALAVWLR